jgi:hypothetical protein
MDRWQKRFTRQTPRSAFAPIRLEAQPAAISKVVILNSALACIFA